MRNYQKKKIQNFINTLYEAHDEIKKSMEMDAVTQAMGLLAQCQEAAIKIGTLIEETVGEGFTTIELLEQYCELLFQIHEDLDQMQNVSVGKAHKTLRRQLIRIENSVKNDIPVRLEAVFLPYKASMWDSLESVWQAAEEDKNCDAYVIPIPYYDRNPDGSLGEMHYEGEQFPEYVPITHYEEYNLEDRRPDMIYIHNPYDGQNFVTSVHPAFYSEQLKQYTDCLVYIEYGLPLWMWDNSAAVERQKIKKDGVILPAHLHCHHYIAYSKEISEYFKTLFSCYPELQKNANLTPKRINEIFVPLGSPKFDKVLRDKRENYILPQEWARITAGKKIILYNCSLGELLATNPAQTGENSYFQKVRSITDVFRDREDAVIWWRPHPLFETTLLSMRPSLLEEYREIVNDFQTSHLGIFDDSQNLHRAIACSDAMISDESSLLFLYTATGKPFFIPSITKARPNPVHDTGEDFQAPLERRLEHMRAAKGANVGNWNTCIWWHNFLEEDLLTNTHFDHFTERFLDYVVHRENYPQAEEYERLQIQMFRDFVANTDGTAGSSIYQFVKEKTEV